MSFDLLSYIDRFAVVCERKFGRRYDLGELEKRLAVHHDGKHLLTAKDVARGSTLTRHHLPSTGRGPTQKLWKQLSQASDSSWHHCQ